MRTLIFAAILSICCLVGCSSRSPHGYSSKDIVHIQAEPCVGEGWELLYCVRDKKTGRETVLRIDRIDRLVHTAR